MFLGMLEVVPDHLHRGAPLYICNWKPSSLNWNVAYKHLDLLGEFLTTLGEAEPCMHVMIGILTRSFLIFSFSTSTVSIANGTGSALRSVSTTYT
jgi:hypothetical protein